MSSSAIQMRQEPSTETPMVNRVLSFRTETVNGWITKATDLHSPPSMTVMYTKRMEQASTGTVKVQTYIICLYSKAWMTISKSERSGITAVVPDFLPWTHILIKKDMLSCERCGQWMARRS